ncbi:hypothetical protein ACXR0O_05230 [Verrucomicrobiota bacterium sgz303538]
MSFPPFRFICLIGSVASCLLLGSTRPASAVDLTQKSVSSSNQFAIYCPDSAVRARISSFADDVRRDVLALIGENNFRASVPNIVLTLDRAAAGNPAEPVTFGVYRVPGGFKVCIDVKIGDNPAAVNLQRHLVRAVLVEYAYRTKPEAIEDGIRYTEPPWWLVEGAIQISRRRDLGLDTDFFRRLIETNKLPPIEQFLVNKPAEFGQTAQAIDQACAMCLVQLLVEQPNGRSALASLLKHLPDSSGDPVAELAQEFPTLGTGQNLQRWWTLNLARFSAADRYKGLSPEETDAQLSALIQFDLPIGKDGDARTYTLSQFDEFLKLPASRAALLRGQAGMVTLSTQANALYRPVIAEYEQIFALLARGKTRGIRERITKVERYRESVLRRTADIADYLNWFEATKMESRSDAFDGYLKVANELEAPVKRNDPISQYLDEVAQELSLQ